LQLREKILVILQKFLSGIESPNPRFRV